MAVCHARRSAVRRAVVQWAATLLGVLAAAQSVSAQSIKIAWDPNTEGDLAGYRVYIGTASRSYSQSYEVAGDTPVFAYLNPVPGTRYFFAVTAYNQVGLESELSNEVSAVYEAASIPAAPELVSPSGVDLQTVIPVFTWKPVANAASYAIWVDDVTARGRIQGTYTSAQLGCAAGGVCVLSPGTTVTGLGRWWVKAINAAGEGPWSAPMSFYLRPWWWTTLTRR